MSNLIDQTPTEAFHTTEPRDTPPAPAWQAATQNTSKISGGIPLASEPPQHQRLETTIFTMLLIVGVIINQVCYGGLRGFVWVVAVSVGAYLLVDSWQSYKTRQWQKQTIRAIEQYNHVMIVAYDFDGAKDSTITIYYPETGKARSYALYQHGKYAYIGAELA